MLTRIRAGLAGLLLTSVVAAAPAEAVTITFTGNIADGQGVIGHGGVAAAATPWAANYGALGVVIIYTRLVTPDAFDFTTGGELPIGSNVPAQPFGGTAATPHGAEPLGITGPMHFGMSGFTLDYTGADLAFLSPTLEHRVYRNGMFKIFEETAPNTFVELGEILNAVLDFEIDYLTGQITGTTTGTPGPTTPDGFPVTFTSTAFDPINLAGTTSEGPYGRFSSTATFEVTVPEPGMLALLGIGLAGLGFARRRRA